MGFTRYEDVFIDREAVIAKREELIALVAKLLTKITKGQSMTQPVEGLGEIASLDKIIIGLKSAT